MYIAIVEDRREFADLLQDTLRQYGYQVALYASGSDVMQGISDRHLPDIILMDINLPDISGVELTGILRERYPAIEVIMQTIDDNADIIIKAIEAGASGYVLKSSASDEILQAIDIVSRGGSFMSGSVARKVLQKFVQAKKQHNYGYGERFSLSEQEEKILTELINGATDKEIAAKLNISRHTVNNYLRKIYRKMQVNSRAEAVSKAINEL